MGTKDWREKYREKLRTPAEAMQDVRPGDVVVFNGVADNESLTLGRALGARRKDLQGVRVRHLCPALPQPWFIEDLSDAFKLESAFAGTGDRQALREGWGDYVPWPFSIGPRQNEDDRGGFYSRPDVFITKVSAPDDKGYCSFGHMTWVGPTASQAAKTIIAEVHEEFPFTYGDNVIHVNQIASLTEADPADKVTFNPSPPPEDEVDSLQVIGALCASLVRDGDTLQVGTGTASQAVLSFLGDKNDLGIHSELVFPQFIEMEKAGNITGKYKTDLPGKIVTSAVVVPPGDPALAEPYLRHVEMNERYHLYDIGLICHLPRIAQQFRMVAINNALAIDLTGQVAIDIMPDGQVMSGIGGQFDFSVGANYSKGGRAVTVLLSTAKGGTLSRIVPRFPAGAVVSLPRGLVDYVVTEHGIVNIQGKSLRDRAEALISIASPAFRDELRLEARKMFSGAKIFG